MRVLVVGAGTRGRVWARVAASSPGVTLAGVVDPDRTRLDAIGGAPGGPPGYADLAGALEAAAPDAVIVATPPATHAALVGAAIDRRLPVLCEKPLSEDLGEALALVVRARDADVPLLVGMNFRYLPAPRRIRQHVREGALGTLSHGQFVYLRHRDGRRADLNDYPMRMAHPMLHEQSIHHFDLLRYGYAAEVDSLVADTWRPGWSTYDGDCCVSVLFRLENGARVNYLGTWTAAWNRMVFSWRSEFAAGVLLQRSQFEDLVRVDFDPSLASTGARFKTAAEAEPARPEHLEPCTPFVDDSRGLLAELVAAVRGDAALWTTGRDHLRTLCLVEACLVSLDARRWVSLREIYDRAGIRGALGADP